MSLEPPVKRTASKRQEVRHDPITRKGRSSFTGNGNPTTADTGRTPTEKGRTPRKSKRRVHSAVSVTAAEVRDLGEEARQMNGEHATLSRLRTRTTVTNYNAVAMDIDPPSSEEESGPDPVRHRAAVGHHPLNRSPLTQPPHVHPATTEQRNPSATAIAPGAVPSIAMRIDCYPLTRRPPLEGSDITLPLPETADSPSIVVHPPSDEENSPPEWKVTHPSTVKPREKPYQSRRRSASLRPRTDRKGRYREDDKTGKEEGKKGRAGRSRRVI